VFRRLLRQLSVNTEAALLVYIEGRLVSNPYRVTFLDLGYMKPSAFDVGISWGNCCLGGFESESPANSPLRRRPSLPRACRSKKSRQADPPPLSPPVTTPSTRAAAAPEAQEDDFCEFDDGSAQDYAWSEVLAGAKAYIHVRAASGANVPAIAVQPVAPKPNTPTAAEVTTESPEPVALGAPASFASYPLRLFLRDAWVEGRVVNREVS